MTLLTFFIWAATIFIGALGIIWSKKGYFNMFLKVVAMAIAVCGVVLLCR